MELCTDDLARTAFDAAAAVYDDLTAHHDYEMWIGAIEPIARGHGLPARGQLLDVGCGTGKSFEPWLARGWRVTACDQSPGMLERAAARAGARARLAEADARALPVLGSYNLVQLLDDVVNYLAPHELVPAFSGVAANLAPDGLLVFDLNTLRSYRGFFAETEVHELPDRVVLWRGGASEAFGPGDVADAVLDAFVLGDDGAWTRHRGQHRQYHHPRDRVRAALEEAGLRLLGSYGQDYGCTFDERVDELHHTKSVLIASHQTPGSEGGR